MQTGIIQHIGPGGTSPGDRMKNAGYNFVWFFKGSENGAGTPMSNPEKEAGEVQTELFIDPWETPPGHRLNIMDPQVREIGFGFAGGRMFNTNYVFGIMDTAVTSVSGPFLTGVAYTDSVNHNNFYNVGEGIGGVTITVRRTSDNAVFTTTSYATGGYSLPLAAGTYAVGASGGALGGTVNKGNVTIGTDNVKEDFTPFMVNGTSPPPPVVPPVVPPSPPPSVLTPFGNGPLAISATGGTTIEAENYDKGGEGVAYHDMEATNFGQTTYRGSDGVDLGGTDRSGGLSVGWIRAGEWLKYTVNVAQAGTYNVDFRVASSGNGGGFHLESDGADLTGRMNIPNTGGWNNWQTMTKSVTLSAGTHVLTVAFDANGASGYAGNFDAMTVRSGGAPVTSSPFSTGPLPISATVPTMIQLENFDNGGEGVGYHDGEAANLGGLNARPGTGVDLHASGDSDGTARLSYTRAGEWLKYTVNVAQAGTYNLDFRVASAASGGSLHLESDGVDVTGKISVPNTGGWDNWQTITKASVALSAGQHVLRLAFDTAAPSGYVGDVNWMQLTKVG